MPDASADRPASARGLGVTRRLPKLYVRVIGTVQLLISLGCGYVVVVFVREFFSILRSNGQRFGVFLFVVTPVFFTIGLTAFFAGLGLVRLRRSALRWEVAYLAIVLVIGGYAIVGDFYSVLFSPQMTAAEILFFATLTLPYLAVFFLAKGPAAKSATPDPADF